MCFHYIAAFALVGARPAASAPGGDVGLVPSRGVDADSGEDAGLQKGGPGRELDSGLLDVEGDGPDAFELAHGPGGREVLVCEVGVAHVGLGQRPGHERFDDGGVDAHRDMAPHAALGPVAHGAQAEEVLEHTEAVLNLEELAVGPHHRGS